MSCGRSRATSFASLTALLAVALIGAACSEPTAVDQLDTGTTTVTPALGDSIDVPITPIMEIEPSAFEGFTVYSATPADATGVVYVFHGSGGSADFALKVETMDVLNELWSQGIGFVATESTSRRDGRQWDNDDLSLETNLDLARLRRLHDSLLADGSIRPETPLFALGMSNGSGFATVWSEAMAPAGYPVAAVAKYMAGVPGAVAEGGGVTIPTFMVVATNDAEQAVTKQRRDRDRIERSGTPLEYHELVETPISADRYLRIPGVDVVHANQIVGELEAAGLINDRGMAVADFGSIVSGSVTAPPGLQPEVTDQSKAALAMHQMNATFRRENAAFFVQTMASR